MRMTSLFRSPDVRTGSAALGPIAVRRWRAMSGCCLLAALLCYGAGPLVTLRLAANALRSGNADVLRLTLDWRSVRDGLKQDIGSAPPLAPSLTSSGTATVDELPAFGESFATTVVSHAIDDQVTPEKLVGMLSGPSTAPSTGWRQALGRIVSIGFAGPTRFNAAIRMTDDPGASPLLLSLRLSRWQWRITRVHLPDDNTAPTARTDRT